ncbi:F-box protein SKIP27-like [Malania oleifera]|uniref:F-box protein SKIP27-like n=1 Tax=Malania oleifera TaxID=397392 RepID=UPI0025AE15D7|nr:F-box protein SKIP27-like [Malania oleifera]
MTIGKKCGAKVKRGGVKSEEGYTRALGRKRIVVWDDLEVSPVDSILKTPTKKQREEPTVAEPEEESLLESLPQDILIEILCGTNHDDLKHLFHVSKSVREAALIAKKLHFAYNTPTKIRAFRTSTDFDNLSESDEFQIVNAPKQSRAFRSRFGRKKLADVSVALFA